MNNNKRLGAGLGLIQRLALAPYTVWAALFMVVPLLFVAYYAFTDDNFHFTTANIVRFFAETSITETDGVEREIHTYLLIFCRSLKLAVISTVICLLMGYPFALMLSRARPRVQGVLITLIMIPMWMNFLIRTYAWVTILQDTGILLGFLRSLGLNVDNVHITGTETAIVIGMVYDFFPYMILPIYSVMAKMDVKLIEAARDLGCGGFGVLRRVIWPLSLPGVISGIIMVLIPSISTFYITQVLGNSMLMMIGDVIERQYLNAPHFASALAFILMVLLLVCMALLQRFANKRASV